VPFPTTGARERYGTIPSRNEGKGEGSRCASQMGNGPELGALVAQAEHRPTTRGVPSSVAEGERTQPRKPRPRWVESAELAHPQASRQHVSRDDERARRRFPRGRMSCCSADGTQLRHRDRGPDLSRGKGHSGSPRTQSPEEHTFTGRHEVRPGNIPARWREPMLGCALRLGGGWRAAR
jgi:hypothetical protein